MPAGTRLRLRTWRADGEDGARVVWNDAESGVGAPREQARRECTSGHREPAESGSGSDGCSCQR